MQKLSDKGSFSYLCQYLAFVEYGGTIYRTR